MKRRGELHCALAVRRTIEILRAACLGVALLLPAAAQAPPQSNATEWKLSTALGPVYPQGRAGVIWAELIRERSGGRLNVKVFPGGTLVPRDPAREFAALRDGATDLAVGSASSWAPQVKELNLLALPWLVPDRDALDRLLQGEITTRLSAAVLAAGVVPLAWAGDGFLELATRRPIHLPADLSGLSLRVASSPLLLESLQALDAAPVSMSAADALAAQRRGTLDGQVTSVPAYGTSRLHAAGFARLLLWGAHADALLFAVNRAVWDRWSDAERDLVLQAARDAALQANAMARKLSDTAALAELSRRGATVTRLTPSGRQRFREAARPIYDRWAAVVGADLVRAAEAAVAAPPLGHEGK
ncbi:MAG: TRAP transporter substrate-binding protein DctP [Pseudomonadota bacterium]|nr:TRAP transporter substrate-binding protein DctP [Pseudomonadota bacterium]